MTLNWDDRIEVVIGQLQELDEPILGRLVGCTQEDILQIEYAASALCQGVVHPARFNARIHIFLFLTPGSRGR